MVDGGRKGVQPGFDANCVKAMRNVLDVHVEEVRAKRRVFTCCSAGIGEAVLLRQVAS